MEQKNITIYDIAAEAGVSASTVSRVITGNVAVSKEKADKVRKAIEKYQFAPNAMAKGLKEQRSKVIGVIVPNIKNPYFSNLFYEIQIRAIKEDFMVFLCNTNGDRQIERKMLRELMNKQAEAVVIIGGAVDYKDCEASYIKELEQLAQKMPIVITTSTSRLGCIKVVNNDEQCMRFLTSHLAKQGYKKVALIGGNNGVIPSYDRRKFFIKYAAVNGLEAKKEWMLDGGFDIQDGIELMEKLWLGSEKPDAVCCINDLVALGVLKFTHEKGIRVPGDIGVMGCDGITLGMASSPELTTVATPYEVFGEEIIKAILKALKEKVYKSKLVIDMELKKRQST